jgi:N-acetyl-anhydromuramyl-L-alanine amidase AmpD
MNKQKAEEFFRQLEAFSKEYLGQLGLTYPSPWSSDGYDDGKPPKGAIIHYTADMNLESSLKWFCIQKYEAKASAQVVVAPRRMGSADRLLAKYPLVDELPVTVVQVVPPTKKAWHATWANGWAFGIENTNAGELRKDPTSGQLMHWRPAKPGSPDWTTPWADAMKQPIEANGRWWDNYPTAQIKANIVLLRYVNALFGDSLQPSWILGHEQVQGKATRKADGTPGGTQKRDPGPTYPLHDVRRAVLSHDPDDARFIGQYDCNPAYAAQQFDAYVTDAVAAMAGVRPSREVAWQRFDAAIRALPERAEFGIMGKLALKLLGFHITALAVPELDSDDLTSIWVFQKLMGLKTDSQPGKMTKQAIVQRLVDRGFLRDLQKG